jgi:hypothetical protein
MLELGGNDLRQADGMDPRHLHSSSSVEEKREMYSTQEESGKQ